MVGPGKVGTASVEEEVLSWRQDLGRRLLARRRTD